MPAVVPRLPVTTGCSPAAAACRHRRPGSDSPGTGAAGAGAAGAAPSGSTACQSRPQPGYPSASRQTPGVSASARGAQVPEGLCFPGRWCPFREAARIPPDTRRAPTPGTAWVPGGRPPTARDRTQRSASVCAPPATTGHSSEAGPGHPLSAPRAVTPERAQPAPSRRELGGPGRPAAAVDRRLLTATNADFATASLKVPYCFLAGKFFFSGPFNPKAPLGKAP